MRRPLKPPALVPGSTIAVVAPASSAKAERIQRGCDNLTHLDYRVTENAAQLNADGYFSAPLKVRQTELQKALTRSDVRGVFCTRGGYGSAELLEGLKTARMKRPKIFCAFSDLTSVHIFLWEKLRWVT